MITIAYADGPTTPRCSPFEALTAAGLDGSPFEVLLGWTPEAHEWLADERVRGTGLLAGYGVAGAVHDGRITPLPVRLGAVPTMLRQRPPEVAVVGVVRRGDGFAFNGSVGWADVLASVAASVVVEVDEDGVDLGGPDLVGNVVAETRRRGGPTSAPRAVDDVDRAIAGHVVSLVPDDATVQFGLGGVADAIAAAIDRPVRLWSGLLTDAAAAMHDRGLLAGPVTASYTWGRDGIVGLHDAGMLELVSATVTHDVGRLAAIPRFVACNGALQVGLDGSVNLERVGGRTIAGIGGHADFSAGASRSVGGVAVVAVRSTARSGEPSIVDRVDVVSTPRCDVDVVVTEHGIADLRGVGEVERADRLRSIATA